MTGPALGDAPNTAGGPSLWPVAIVWGLAAAVALATFVTYSRIEPAELYHVSNRGLAGGASRLLVLLNFPVAILALAMLPLLVARLLAAPVSPARRATVLGVAGLAAALTLVTAWPGVVDQADLDAKPINAVPAAGVALVLALTVAAVRTPRPSDTVRERQLFETPLRFGLLGAIGFVSLPWMFADLGFYIEAVPGLGTLFVSEEFLPEGATLAAVHYGHHHGFDGAIFAASALILMPAVVAVPGKALRHTSIALVALMFAYGVMNLAQDFWGEQVVKRGWSGAEFPEVVRPGITPAWGLIVLGGVALYLYLARPQRPALETLRSPAA